MANLYGNGFSYAVRTSDAVHWGIKGMKWGVRRFQNADGTLTPLGRKRYLDGTGRLTEAGQKRLDANAYAKASGVKATTPKIAPEPNGPRQMTKAQLQSANERAKLEQEYLKNKTAVDRMAAKSQTKTDRADKKIADMTDIEFEEYVSRVVKEKELYAAKKDITQFKHDELTQAEKIMGKATRHLTSGVKLADAVGEVYNVAAKAHNVTAAPADKWGFYEKKSPDKPKQDAGKTVSDNKSSKKDEKKRQKDQQEQQEAVIDAMLALGQGLTYGVKKKKKK